MDEKASAPQAAEKSEEGRLSPGEVVRLCNEAIEFCKTAHPPVGEGRVAWERFLAEAGFFSECIAEDLAVLDDLAGCDKHECKKRKERILSLKYLLQQDGDVLKECDQLRSRKDIQAELGNLYEEELGDSWTSEDRKWIYWRLVWVQFCRQVRELPDPICDPDITPVEEFWKDRWKEIAETWLDARERARKSGKEARPKQSATPSRRRSTARRLSTAPSAPAQEMQVSHGGPINPKWAIHKPAMLETLRKYKTKNPGPAAAFARFKRDNPSVFDGMASADVQRFQKTYSRNYHEALWKESRNGLAISSKKFRVK